MARAMSNALLWAIEGFNLTNMRDVMDSTQIADLLRRLDSPRMLEKIARAQEETALSGSPVTKKGFKNGTKNGIKNELEQFKRLEDILIEDTATPTTRRDIREAEERFDLVDMKDSHDRWTQHIKASKL
jgi:hypothetical protein